MEVKFDHFLFSPVSAVETRKSVLAYSIYSRDILVLCDKRSLV